MADLHRPRLTITEAGQGGTPWAYGGQVLYDAHERRAGDRARESEVAARVAAARARAAEACGAEPTASSPSTWDELHEAWQSRRAVAPAASAPDPPRRCAGCGYLTTAPGHLAECGMPGR